MNNQFNIPQKDEVSPKNQTLFDEMQKAMGQVPNLYATFAYSENALEAYSTFENAPTSLSDREAEAVNLTVSEENKCGYCLSAHRLVAKENEFNEQEIAELRRGKASFDPKLDALCRLAKNIVEHQQEHQVDPELIDAFFKEGFTKENLVDTILLIGIRTISNHLHAVTNAPIDFELAPGVENY